MLFYKPDINPEKILENLSSLVAPGEINDRDIQGRISRIRQRFRVFSSTCPFGPWAPGSAITADMRAMIDLYLPMVELRKTFQRFLFLTLKYFPPATGTAVDTAATWPDMLHVLHPYVTGADPAALLERLAADGTYRTGFLFALFLPKRHGGSFHRYPGQLKFIRKWLGERTGRATDNIRCLDAACATGESTYELFMLLMKIGLPPESFLVHGSTIDPLELFAAAHVFFPHQPARQESFRRETERVFASGVNGRMAFFTEDVTRPRNERGERYDIILCNGLLGGPRFHAVADLEGAVSALGSRLRKGGILLAADRFHGGWKKCAPASLLHRIFTEFGFRVRDIGDGLVAEKE